MVTYLHRIKTAYLECEGDGKVGLDVDGPGLGGERLGWPRVLHGRAVNAAHSIVESNCGHAGRAAYFFF